MTPNLENIFTYKSVWALCVINKDGRLRATHYASCYVAGRAPVWGLWTINGKFVRLFNGRESIIQSYPGHVWRRWMMKWGLKDDADTSAAERRHILPLQLNTPLPEPPNESNVQGNPNKAPERDPNRREKLH